MKPWMTRSQAKCLQSEYPVGDPHGGPAAGKKQDPVTAAVVVGGTYLASRETSKGAGKAAGISAGAADRATAEQSRQYDLSRADQMPWLDVGREQGLYSLRDIAKGDMSGFYNSPDYQFRLGEGERAIQRRASAGGAYNSGNTMKDLLRFNQGLASTEFGDFWNRRAGLANVGQTTAGGLGALGQATAGNIGNIGMTNAANAGNAAMASANARGSMYQGIGNTLGSMAAYGQQGGWGANTARSPMSQAYGFGTNDVTWST